MQVRLDQDGAHIFSATGSIKILMPYSLEDA